VPKPQPNVTTDYAAVAGSAVLGAPGIRVCLLVSTDGLPLGAYPATDERRAASAWTRLSSLGRVARGFVVVDDEMWAFHQDERHGVLLLADPKVRAAVLLEVADQVLITVREVGGLSPADGEEGRGGHDGRDLRDLRPPVERRLRTTLHPDARQLTEPAVAEPASDRVPAVVALEDAEVSDGTTITDAIADAIAQAVAEAGLEAGPIATVGSPAPSEPDGDADRGQDEMTGADEPTAPAVDGVGDIDVVALAREFSGLLFDREDGMP
jgi:hypothetical protein